MYTKYAVAPLVFALVEFFYECHVRMVSGKNITSAVIGAGKSAVATFIFGLVLVYCADQSMTPV